MEVFIKSSLDSNPIGRIRIKYIPTGDKKKKKNARGFQAENMTLGTEARKNIGALVFF